MVRPCSRHGKNACIVVVGKHEGKITLGRQRYCGMLLLKFIYRRQGERLGTRLIWFRTGTDSSLYSTRLNQEFP
jgi:hypothetical protein